MRLTSPLFLSYVNTTPAGLVGQWDHSECYGNFTGAWLRQCGCPSMHIMHIYAQTHVHLYLRKHIGTETSPTDGINKECCMHYDLVNKTVVLVICVSSSELQNIYDFKILMILLFKWCLSLTSEAHVRYIYHALCFSELVLTCPKYAHTVFNQIVGLLEKLLVRTGR